MSDDTLRGQIRKLVYMNTYATEDGREWLNQYQMTDRIIELVREALLSDAAVHAGARAITADPAFGTNRWTDDARNVLTAALDAAGLGGDGHE